MRRKALGRGLSSLIPAMPTAPAEDGPPSPFVEIDLDRIDANPRQPRQRFVEEALEELTASIAHHGVVQPVLVRRRADRYEMVAGERRLRAAQRAGLRKIPAVVREVADDEMLEVSLIENIQRAELDPIEEACAYRDLQGELELTQSEVAERVGKDRATISNSLRLLSLSDNLQSAIREGSISAGHARALLAVPEGPARDRLARRILQRGLSVREAERWASSRGSAAGEAAGREEAPDPNTRAAEERMMAALGTRVRIRRQGKGGKIEATFHNEEELQRIFEWIVRE